MLDRKLILNAVTSRDVARVRQGGQMTLPLPNFESSYSPGYHFIFRFWETPPPPPKCLVCILFKIMKKMDDYISCI